MDKTINEFKKLLEVSEQLMGPDGCPWDREQTLVSMRDSVLEEACEVIEAIDEEDDTNLVEELGDLLYNVIFFCNLGEKEGRFQLYDAIHHIREKLIARHPHVFGEKKVKDAQAVIEQWEQIKREEKKHRESLMDGIPKGLPALARGYKIAGKFEKTHKELSASAPSFENEKDLGVLLWEITKAARKRGLNPEIALRKELMVQEHTFREKEKSDKSSS